MLAQVWNSGDISKNTKLHVYETLMYSLLIYNSETWTMKATLRRRLEAFEMACFVQN